MNKYTCIIVDDEELSRINILKMIEHSGMDLDILAEAETGKQAIQLINELKPQIVFLDIEMPYGNGFDVLKQVEKRNFEVIFITAYEQYALKAIKESALDYLVKPVSKDELINAVKRAIESIKENIHKEANYNHLLKSDDNQLGDKKIMILVGNVYELIELKNIVRCKADNNYTEFYLVDGRKLLVSKTLKYYEDLLQEYNFCRVHQSHLVNIAFIKQLEKGKFSHLTMKDGTSIELSQAKKDELYQKLNTLN
jgi:two-component system, LytTR family, response regulator